MKRFYKRVVLIAALVLCVSSLKAQQTTELNYATFNIRLDTKQDGEKNWKYRKDSIVNFIQAQNLDIFGMQEVLPKPLKFLNKKLKKTYSYIGVGREDGKHKGEHTPIFYNKKRFKVMDSGNFWLSQTPNQAGSMGWDAACTRVVTWGKFLDKQSGKTFMIINTHFDHVGRMAQENSAYLILDSIQSIAGDLPVIMSGDFNVTDTCIAYKTLTSSKDYTLKDSHKIAKQRVGNTYTFHDFGRRAQEKRGKIDFIFVNEAFSVEESFIPFESKTTEGFFLSDHNPVRVRLMY